MLLGLLNVDVIAAADGTGKVIVAPLMVRAGDLATLTFTYTSTQTIQGGELRFTVPSGWSPTPSKRGRGRGLHRCQWAWSWDLCSA